MRSPLNIILRNGTVTPDRLPGLAAWYSADYGVLTQVGGGTAFASANSQKLTITGLSLGLNDTFTCAYWIKRASAVTNICVNFGSACKSYVNNIGQVFFEHPAGNIITPQGSSTDWFFVVFGMNAGTAFLSINGAGAITNVSASVGTRSVLYLGVDSNGSSNYLNGSMDEIAVWSSKALSATEITWLYNNGAGRTYAEADSSLKANLVSWWSMNAPASGNWIDQHGTNHLSPSASRPTATNGVTFRGAGEGETVRRWLDRSGNGRHGDQVTLAYQPTVISGQIQFGASKYFDVVSALTTYAYMFCVYSDPSPVSYSTPVGCVYSTTGVYHGGVTTIFDLGNTSPNTRGAANAINGVSIGDGTGASKTSVAQRILSSVAGSAFTGGQFNKIGADGTIPTARAVSGVITEIVLGNLPLSQRQTVGMIQYLARRWGIAI